MNIIQGFFYFLLLSPGWVGKGHCAPAEENSVPVDATKHGVGNAVAKVHGGFNKVDELDLRVSLVLGIAEGLTENGTTLHKSYQSVFHLKETMEDKEFDKTLQRFMPMIIVKNPVDQSVLYLKLLAERKKQVGEKEEMLQNTVIVAKHLVEEKKAIIRMYRIIKQMM